jgi:hypothetical protein
MKLEELVPPLELCKLIPEGEFEDSALMWIEVEIPQEDKKEWRVANATKPILACHNPKHPAPTLQEILEDLPQGVELSRDSEWFCSLDMTNEYYEKTPATAALKVWLKLKGIEV